MEGDFVRKMPAAIEAEQAVLGSILIKPEAFETVAGILKAEDFYAEDHKAVFSAMRDMFLQSKKIDAVTLINNMKALGTYTDENLLAYVKNLLGAESAHSPLRKDRFPFVRQYAPRFFHRTLLYQNIIPWLPGHFVFWGLYVGA